MIESPVDSTVFPGTFEQVIKDSDLDNIFLAAMHGDLKLSPKVSLTPKAFSLGLTPRGATNNTPKGFKTGLTPKNFTGLTPKSFSGLTPKSFAALTPKSFATGLTPKALGITPRNNNGKTQPECVVYDSELEPFVFSAGKDNDRFFPFLNPEAAANASTSLGDVFDDPQLMEEIMCSLQMDQKLTPRLIATPTCSRGIPATTVVAAPHVMPTLPSLPALPALQPIVAPPPSMPCIRKPGTFLNKDGRWIKGKPCRMHNCDKRAQSNGLCKGHGGGARCSFKGCTKSSQGGGFCRAHGGGKRCLFEGCEKGTQRNGFCYLHGGVRSCSVEGCEKKDRGNGKCFAHGGGRKCNTAFCANTTRRGMFCGTHTAKK